MAQQKRQPSNRPASKRASKTKGEKSAEWNERDEELKRRFIDQSGIVAQDLPEAAHGQNAVPYAHDMERNLPHQHGGVMGGEGGLRGARDISDADDHGGRKSN